NPYSRRETLTVSHVNPLQFCPSRGGYPHRHRHHQKLPGEQATACSPGVCPNTSLRQTDGLEVNVPFGPTSFLGCLPTSSTASHNARGDTSAPRLGVTTAVP